MEKLQILKSLGFSDEFLKSIEDNQESFNTITINDSVGYEPIQLNNFDGVNNYTISSLSENYNKEFVIRQP
jgi:hypothetical protein